MDQEILLKARIFDLRTLEEHGTYEQLYHYLLSHLPPLESFNGLVEVRPDVSIEELRTFIQSKRQEASQALVNIFRAKNPSSAEEDVLAALAEEEGIPAAMPVDVSNPQAVAQSDPNIGEAVSPTPPQEPPIQPVQQVVHETAPVFQPNQNVDLEGED